MRESLSLGVHPSSIGLTKTFYVVYLLICHPSVVIHGLPVYVSHPPTFSCTFADQIHSEADKQYNQWNICELAY